MTEPPLIVQTDGAVLLETQHPQYEPARERLARFKCPKEIRFQEVPKTSTGKIQKYVLRKAIG